MFGKAMLGALILKGFLASGYFAFFYNPSKKVKVKLLESDQHETAELFNNFLATETSNETLDELVDNLNWIIKNDYAKDIRVKRVIHQDLKGLVAISRLIEKLDREDREASLAYDQALNTIADRVARLRHVKDENLRDQILMLGEMIEENDK